MSGTPSPRSSRRSWMALHVAKMSSCEVGGGHRELGEEGELGVEGGLGVEGWLGVELELGVEGELVVEERASRGERAMQEDEMCEMGSGGRCKRDRE